MYTFKGTYSAGTQYSVGDVVIYSDNLAYHLQQAADAGTDCHNTRYWGQMDKGMTEAILLMNQCITIAINGALVGKVANNLTTTDEGKVLDARQGGALKTLIDTLGETVGGLGTTVGGLSTTVNGLLPDSKTLVLASSTSESTKLMAITVADDGTITAAEYTPPAEETPGSEET